MPLATLLRLWFLGNLRPASMWRRAVAGELPSSTPPNDAPIFRLPFIGNKLLEHDDSDSSSYSWKSKVACVPHGVAVDVMEDQPIAEALADELS